MLSAVYAVVVCLTVCPSVCVSVTLWYYIKTAKRRITQIMPYDSPLTLVSDTKVHGEIRMVSPKAMTNAGGVGKNSPLTTKNVL